jgi:hypothetical protein
MWPAGWRPIAAEAWRRSELGMFEDDDLYSTEAQHAGLAWLFIQRASEVNPTVRKRERSWLSKM